MSSRLDLLLLLTLAFPAAHLATAHRFLVMAPSVFHVGVKETVLVQGGETLLNKNVTCYLEQEVKRVLMSEKEPIEIKEKGQIQTLELEVPVDKGAELQSTNGEPPYLNLVCDVGEKERQIARVLLSQHRGYIFIQTNQPIYNPTQPVRYRIFVLDHAMKPKSGYINIHLINAEGYTFKKMEFNVNGGIISKTFHIPDISQPGVWKIKAFLSGDEKNATIREFKVQKFVLPSFGVLVQPDSDYILLKASPEEPFTFSIAASYSYGKKISGAFHCRFGVRSDQSEDVRFIHGLEKTGSIRDGEARVDVNMTKVMEKAPEDGAQFYIAVTVTDSLSGEIQETEMFLPIVSQRYTVDLSRTRQHYIPHTPLDILVVVRTPRGQPAADLPVTIAVTNTVEKSVNIKTNEQGTATSSFNLNQSPSSITVEVTVDGEKTTRTIHPATSSTNSFLYININHKILQNKESLSVGFTAINGKPEDDHIYYTVISKGAVVSYGSLRTQEHGKINLQFRNEMVPSFRLIGYYYHSDGELVADSVWVDVEDECEGKIKLTSSSDSYSPKDSIPLTIDVGSQTTSVALLAVDKAIYALNVQNKLTPQQVFASMQSYDLGCSYGGGVNTAAVFNDAGMTFISHSETLASQMRKGFGCESGFRRQRRAIDLQKEMTDKELKFSDKALRRCCRAGLMVIPMQLSCEERRSRISESERRECAEVFLECCHFAVKLREKKRQEEMQSGHGRTASASMIEEFFDNDMHMIRNYFPPSFEFNVIKVTNGSPRKHTLYAPDSITTWEIQAISLSSSHGICVANPLDIRVFKPRFLAMRLPYSVKRNEQLAIAVVIYNYGREQAELAVSMKQVDGLCSPGTQSSKSYINITVAPESAETVTFSVVPLKDGEIPIRVRLYDRENEDEVDDIEKPLRVKTEGVEKREEESWLINLDGKSDKTYQIDGMWPNMTVPDSEKNLFITLEDEAFSAAAAMPLLSPAKVEKLIRAPFGCAEQTMIRMSPTALSIKYLDSSNRWLELPAETRDTALDYLEKAYDRILSYKKADGSYGAWIEYPTSHWLTALVVKVLSIVAECELAAKPQQEIVSQLEIRDPVSFLIKTQNQNGSFSDPNPVIHREMQGGIGGVELDASLTAFITIALSRSLPYLDKETVAVKGAIFNATQFLLSRVQDLQRPYALAITAYCLSTCLPDKKLAEPAWIKLQSLATPVGECKVWRANDDLRLEGEGRGYLVPSSAALTVETTAYALLTALAWEDQNQANAAACYLSSQENYGGGFKSTQDTIMALEALSEYAMRKTDSPPPRISAQFTTQLRSDKEDLVLTTKGEKVEVPLKRLLGGGISAKFSGTGEAKVKVVKAYYDLDDSFNCNDLSITVTVQGKVEYTAQITESYSYDYEYQEDAAGEREGAELPRSSIDWFDVRSRRRRDTQQSSEDTLVYNVCVSHSSNPTGMFIADITLLSGFEANTDDLDKLKDLLDTYISHYELSQGRVLLYFNKIHNANDCISFEAKQRVPVGLVQPAPASFYDYYEPDRRCSVFYSAPKRSKLVSVLCSEEDVCQCAERGCFKEKKTFESKIKMKDRFTHACYQPVMDYGLVVTVTSQEEKGTFQLFYTRVDEILRSNVDVKEDDVQVFIKRKHCKGQLEVNRTYLIMGKDPTSPASRAPTQYLLDSNTWVEQKPEPGKCKASVNKEFCKGFRDFLVKYQTNGCSD